MSGFLHSLAQRESGAAAVLAPRVTGWFEAPAARAPALLAPAEPGRAAAIAPPEAPDPAGASLEPVPHHGARPAPAAQPHIAAPSLTVRPPAPAQGEGPPEASPRDGRRATTPQAAAIARAAAAPPQVRQPAVAPPAADKGSVPPGRARPTEPPAAQSAEQSAEQSAAQSAAPPRGHAATEHPLEPALSAPPVPSRRLAPGALLAAQAGAARRPGPGSSTPAPVPPTIHVTIGRLEVRAVQAAPAPPAPPAPRPRQSPTSLDDYLAQRNGAGRR